MIGSYSNAPGNGRFFVRRARIRPRRARPSSTSPGRAPGMVLARLLLVGLLSACSTADPQLMDLEIRVVARLTENGSGVAEFLVVEADVADPDGADELAELVVELPDAGLMWTVPVEQLRMTSQEGQNWYQTPPLSVNGLLRIPRGTVRVTARDYSGREARDEEPLPLTLPDLEADDLPRLNGTVLLEPGEAWNRLLVAVRGGGGLRIQEVVAAEPPADLRELMTRLVPEPGGDGAPELWLVAEWSPRLWAETGPWPVPARDGTGEGP